MLGQPLQKSEYQRLLALRPLARSAHFALHHERAGVLTAIEFMAAPVTDKLSTDSAQELSKSVDNMVPTKVSTVRLGFVLPKRHAKRAVTRNLLRRQIREVFLHWQPQPAAGLWLVRLTQAWPHGATRSTGAKDSTSRTSAKTPWISAASPGLKHAVRSELTALLSGGHSRMAMAVGARA